MSQPIMDYIKSQLALRHALFPLVAGYALRRIYIAFFCLSDIPLAHWSCRWTALWYGNHDVYDLWELHQKLGPLVRYGPSHVSMSSWESYKQVYSSPKTQFLKYHNYYAAFTGQRSQWNVFTTADLHLHRVRRTQMSSWYSRSALLGPEDLFREKAMTVATRLLDRTKAGHASEVSFAFRCMTLDVITSMAWGKCMNALNLTDDFRIDFLTSLDEQSPQVHLRQLYPEFFFLLADITPKWLLPHAVKQFEVLLEESANCYRQFKAEREERKNFSSFPILFELLQNTPEGEQPMTDTLAAVESMSVLVAGADTTGHTLACLCWALDVGHPEHGVQLRKELKEAIPMLENLDDFTLAQMEKLPFLSACIREVGDAGNGLLARLVPAEGCVLDGKFIPGGCSIGSSSVFIHRNEELFSNAMTFDPYRWLTKDGKFNYALESGMVQFSKGSRMCLGQQLALFEMYMTLAVVYRRCQVVPTAQTPKSLKFRESFIAGFKDGYGVALDFKPIVD